MGGGNFGFFSCELSMLSEVMRWRWGLILVFIYWISTVADCRVFSLLSGLEFVCCCSIAWNWVFSEFGTNFAGDLLKD